MVMVRSIILPEKTGPVMSELSAAGFPAITKLYVFGRGKQKGIKVGDVHCDEIPKVMLVIICNDDEKDDIVKTQIENGAEADLFLSEGQRQMNALAGYIDDTMRKDLLVNRVVLIVLHSSTKDIVSFQDCLTAQVSR